MLRMPASWRGRRPARPRVTATVGGKAPSGLGASALLDFHTDVALDGEPLSEGEVARPLATTDGLALVRGQWVEVDPERLRRTLDELRRVQKQAKATGVSFAEALRMLAGLLGSAREFAAFTKRLAARPHRPFEPLRELTRRQ